CHSRRRFSPTPAKVNGVDDPGDGIKTENRQGDPGPATTLSEEPGEDRVNQPAHDHNSDAGFEEEPENEPGNNRHDAKIVAPSKAPCFGVRTLEAAIQNECGDNGQNQNGKRNTNDLKGNRDWTRLARGFRAARSRRS